MGSLQQHQGAMDFSEPSHPCGGDQTDEGWWEEANRDGLKLLKEERLNKRCNACKNQAKTSKDLR